MGRISTLGGFLHKHLRRRCALQEAVVCGSRPDALMSEQAFRAVRSFCLQPLRGDDGRAEGERWGWEPFP